MIYLSIPYTGMERLSFEISCLITAFLMKTGRTVFSPIVQGHAVASKYDLPKDCDFWLKHDLEALKCCEEMYVVTLEGWEDSVGVCRELEEARRLSIPVTFIEPDCFILDEWKESYEIR
jgi:hypothetical protein